MDKAIIFLFLGLIVFNGIFTYILHSKQTEDNDPNAFSANNLRGVLEYIRENELANIFTEIVSVNAVPSAQCPNGYSTNSFYLWPGYGAGCKCGEKYSRGTDCKSGCERIYGYNFDIYLDNWNGYKLCRKNADWRRKNGETCPNGYRECQANVCVNKTQACPISDVRILPKDQTVSGWERTDFNETHSIFVNRDTTQMPVYRLQAALNGVPCVNKDREQKRSPNEVLFPLDRNDRYAGCDKYGEDSFGASVVDSEPEQNFYADNNLGKQEKIPDYINYHKTDNYNLFARRKLRYKNDAVCYQNTTDQISVISRKIERYGLKYDVWVDFKKDFIIVLAIICFITALPIPCIRRGQPEAFWILLMALFIFDAWGTFGLRGAALEVLKAKNLFNSFVLHGCFQDDVISAAVLDILTQTTDYYNRLTLWASLVLIVDVLFTCIYGYLELADYRSKRRTSIISDIYYRIRGQNEEAEKRLRIA